MSSSDSVKNFVRSFLSLAILIRIALVFLIPFGAKIENRFEGLYDEPSHFNHVRYLALHHAFPVQTRSVWEPGAFERNEWELYQPPLYYAIGALPFAVFGERFAFYFCRFFSLFCGIAAVFLIGAIVYRVESSWLAHHAALLFVAFLPTHAYISALVSNDALTWLFAALIIYQLVHIRSTVPWNSVWLLSFYLIAGMLTKFSIAIFYPLIVLVFLYKYYHSRNATLLLQCCLLVGISMLSIAPWYVRNVQVYGSLFAERIAWGRPRTDLTTLSSIVGLRCTPLSRQKLDLLKVLSLPGVFVFTSENEKPVGPVGDDMCSRMLCAVERWRPLTIGPR